MSVLLIIYLAGFAGYQTKAIVDYTNNEDQSRVVTKGEKLAIDTVTNVAWPAKAYYDCKDILK